MYFDGEFPTLTAVRGVNRSRFYALRILRQPGHSPGCLFAALLAFFVRKAKVKRKTDDREPNHYAYT